MPTVSPRTNPYAVGDVALMVYDNGSGEGVIWQVTKTKDIWLWIDPILTLTGDSVLRPKKVQWDWVQPVDLVKLGAVYLQLGNLIRDIAVRRGAEAKEVPGG
jgi:hypothetical protein